MSDHTVVEPVREHLPASRSHNAVSAAAVGALAAGVLALGAIAIGRLVIGAVSISRARFKRVEIDDLVVRRLHYKNPR